MEPSTIAVIGLSTSSCSLASCFLRTGHDVVVNDPDPSRHREVIAIGARAARLPADAAEFANVAFVTVPAPLVEEVLFDCGGVGDTLPDGACVVVTAELTADALASISARLLLLKLRTVEAQIGSDGNPAPVLLGGRREDVDGVLGLLLSIGCPGVRVGELGAVADFRNTSTHLDRSRNPVRAEVTRLPAMPSRDVVPDPGNEDPAGSLTLYELEQLVCTETGNGGTRRLPRQARPRSSNCLGLSTADFERVISRLEEAFCIPLLEEARCCSSPLELVRLVNSQVASGV